jgi:hypothetical protein
MIARTFISTYSIDSRFTYICSWVFAQQIDLETNYTFCLIIQAVLLLIKVPCS